LTAFIDAVLAVILAFSSMRSSACTDIYSYCFYAMLTRLLSEYISMSLSWSDDC